MTEEELQEHNRRQNMPGECPLNQLERDDHIATVLEDRLGAALDKYFENSPFTVEREQHYQDHLAFGKFRQDANTVKKGFLGAFGRVLALLVIGAVSWSAFIKYIVGK